MLNLARGGIPECAFEHILITNKKRIYKLWFKDHLPGLQFSYSLSP